MANRIRDRRSLFAVRLVGCIVTLLLVSTAIPAWAAVGLVYFDARAASVPSEVIVTWTTETETDVVGFRVKRSSQPLVQTALVVATVPSVGTATTGADYVIVDTGLTPAQTYYYWLSVIDRSGTEMLLTQAVSVIPGSLTGRRYYLPAVRSAR